VLVIIVGAILKKIGRYNTSHIIFFCGELITETTDL